VRESQGIEVDICRVCGGIWLDAGEFDPLVAERFVGEPLERYFEQASQATSAPGSCPVDRVDMLVIAFDDLDVDWCPTCRGVWIDGHERLQISEISGKPNALNHSSSAPAHRELELVSKGVSSELELDFAAVAAVGERETVVCASCGRSTPRSRAMKRMDAFWCEVCVVNGDYPGSHGPPVSRRLAQAALAMSKAEANLHSRKEAVADMKRANEVVRRSGLSRHNDVHVNRAIHATARAVLNLFKRD
jgi:Zn-finger nucleic acid-binding protein